MRREYGEVRECSQETQNLIDKHTNDINHLLKEQNQQFDSINYKTENVNGGTNFLIKVVTENNRFYHITINRNFENDSKLMGSLNNQSYESELN